VIETLAEDAAAPHQKTFGKMFLDLASRVVGNKAYAPGGDLPVLCGLVTCSQILYWFEVSTSYDAQPEIWIN
jgi:hypothetical protein